MSGQRGGGLIPLWTIAVHVPECYKVLSCSYLYFAIVTVTNVRLVVTKKGATCVLGE